MKDAIMVETLREHGFTGMDLPLISKLKRPEYYGIQLTMDARSALGYTQSSRKDISQADRMVAYMEKMDGITSWEAMNILGILSPTKRISEIRRMPGITVKQKWESDGKTRWMRWWIERDKNDI